MPRDKTTNYRSRFGPGDGDLIQRPSLKGTIMTNLLFPIIAGQIRHLLTGVGGALVTGGWLTSDQSIAIIGGLMAAAGAAWSIWQKQTAKT